MPRDEPEKHSFDQYQHMDPEKHMIGETLAAPSVITITGAASLGNSPIAAREDHYHGIDSTVAALLAAAANWGIYQEYTVQINHNIGWAIGNGVTNGRYTQINKFVQFRCQFIAGTTSTYGTGGGGSGQLSFTAPVTIHAAYRQIVDGWALKSGGNIHRIHGQAVGGIYFNVYYVNDVTDKVGGLLSAAGAPFVWGAGDSAFLAGSYEAA